MCFGVMRFMYSGALVVPNACVLRAQARWGCQLRTFDVLRRKGGAECVRFTYSGILSGSNASVRQTHAFYVLRAFTCPGALTKKPKRCLCPWTGTVSVGRPLKVFVIWQRPFCIPHTHQKTQQHLFFLLMFFFKGLFWGCFYDVFPVSFFFVFLLSRFFLGGCFFFFLSLFFWCCFIEFFFVF